ncbi:MAG TPA: L-2-hydroxyglutarate oxidase, partial [Myxococcales bacterium]|nr:L-2-hydroxyglutarate oxidase [Myxococcales bacterium]
LKAKNCTAGRAALIEFCDAHGIPYELCGKVIVATSAEEIPRLEELKRRGDANGVPGLKMIGPEQLREIEPHAYGLKALVAPGTGIIDYTKVAHAYAAELQRLGGQILTAHRVMAISSVDSALRIQTSNGEFTSKYLINCAGLHVDRTARMMGPQPNSTAGAAPRIIPFRGEYYTLVPERRDLVKGLIYPVPDPRFPFLGVHFTRTVHGDVEAGPNAVLALAREGYTIGTVRIGEAVRTFTYRGFWNMGRRYWKMGAYEVYRSMSKAAFVSSLQRLVPGIQAGDIAPGGAGVRAQAVSPDGSLVDDFKISQTEGAIHVLNAPSPAATASLAIGRHIAALAAESFRL